MQDKRLSKIKFNLPKNWEDVSEENPDGPPTFINDKLVEPGVLQISIAEYLSGTIPNPSYQDLIGLSEKLGLKNDFGSIISKESGECNYGKYGKVTFSNHEFPLILVWHISDNTNFIVATFICSKQPDTGELNDVTAILTSIKKRSSLFG